MSRYSSIRAVIAIDALIDNFDSSVLLLNTAQESLTEQELIDRIIACPTLQSLIAAATRTDESLLLQQAVTLSWLRFMRQQVIHRGIRPPMEDFAALLANHLAASEAKCAKLDAIYEQTEKSERDM